MLKYVRGIAVELEGGYKESRSGSFDEYDTHVGTDLTIVLDEGSNHIPREIRPHRPFLSLDDIEEWIHRNYPDSYNDTCGLHIHASVRRPEDYLKLVSPAFNEFFLEKIETWAKVEGLPPEHSFWKRLRGEKIHPHPEAKNYCERKFSLLDCVKQMEGKCEERYRQLNFPYYRFKTVECRVLPMLPVKQCVSATKAFVGIIEEFLSSIPEPPDFTEYLHLDTAEKIKEVKTFKEIW